MEQPASYFIIIRGPLGIGKTTIAKALVKRLDGYYVSIDDISAQHGLDQTDEPCIPARNFVRTNELALPAARKALTSGQAVIFDGNFYHKSPIEHLIQNIDATPYVFTLKAPLEVCIQRDSQRELVYGVDAAAAVHYLVSRFDYGTSIDTEGKTVAQVVAEIEDYLPTKP